MNRPLATLPTRGPPVDELELLDDDELEEELLDDELLDELLEDELLEDELLDVPEPEELLPVPPQAETISASPVTARVLLKFEIPKFWKVLIS
jgi:hypothetical protein